MALFGILGKRRKRILQCRLPLLCSQVRLLPIT
jgi:hypothetical protein